MVVTPVRSCVACRRRTEKTGLHRLAVRDGRIVLDPPARLAGRGAYVCSRRCLQAALRRDATPLRRALRLREPVDVAALERMVERLQPDSGSDESETDRQAGPAAAGARSEAVARHDAAGAQAAVPRGSEA